MAPRKHLVTMSLTTRANSGTQLSDTSRKLLIISNTSALATVWRTSSPGVVGLLRPTATEG